MNQLETRQFENRFITAIQEAEEDVRAGRLHDQDEVEEMLLDSEPLDTRPVT